MHTIQPVVDVLILIENTSATIHSPFIVVLQNFPAFSFCFEFIHQRRLPSQLNTDFTAKYQLLFFLLTIKWKRLQIIHAI